MRKIDFFGKAPSTQRELPEVDGERCVHTLIEQGSCTECVDACPTRAWTLGDESLDLDTERCDRCGLCSTSCPQQAIAPKTSSLVRTGDRGKGVSAWASCDYANAAPGPYQIACIHAISLTAIITAYRQGCARFLFAAGDCEQCPRGRADRLEDRIKPLNDALSQRRLPAIELIAVDPEQLGQQFSKTDEYFADTVVNRRHFFRRSLGHAAQTHANVTGSDADASERVRTIGELLPSNDTEQLETTWTWPWTVNLDTTRCNGCDACASLCPNGAIVKDESAYLLNASHCSGCRICVDVCEPSAISIEAWGTQARTKIELASGRCGACGVLFHRPVANTDSSADHSAPTLCPICAKTNHHSLLYQVLD